MRYERCTLLPRRPRQGRLPLPELTCEAVLGVSYGERRFGVAPLHIERDGRGARRALRQCVGDVPVLLDGQVGQSIGGRPLLRVALRHTSGGYANRPKDTISRDPRVVVTNLTGRLRANLAQENVQSDEAERVGPCLAIFADVPPLHDAHISFEGDRLIVQPRRRVGEAARSLNMSQRHNPVKVEDRGWLVDR